MQIETMARNVSRLTAGVIQPEPDSQNGVHGTGMCA